MRKELLTQILILGAALVLATTAGAAAQCEQHSD